MSTDDTTPSTTSPALVALAWALAWKLPKQPRQLEAVVPAATAAEHSPPSTLH